MPGYERFLEEAERCKTLGFEGMGDMAFDKISDLMAAIPDFLRMGAWRSLYSLVAKHIRNEKLRVVMSFHPLLIGGNPFAVTCAYALINSLERTWGVHSAMGGTGAIVRGLVGLLQARGVPVRCNAPVTQIRIEQGRACGVELETGEFIPADIVVSNADTAWTYKHLVAPEHRRVWSDRKIDKGHYSMGLFVWYFGTSRQYADVPHHMMVLGERYEGLLKDIFKRHHLAKDFSLYLHRPTATDPSLAPEGLHRDLQGDHAARFSRPPVVLQGRRLWPRAFAAPKRLVSPPPPQRRRSRSVRGRRQHSPGCRRARCPHVSQSTRNGGSPCPILNSIQPSPLPLKP